MFQVSYFFLSFLEGGECLKVYELMAFVEEMHTNLEELFTFSIQLLLFFL